MTAFMTAAAASASAASVAFQTRLSALLKLGDPLARKNDIPIL